MDSRTAFSCVGYSSVPAGIRFPPVQRAFRSAEFVSGVSHSRLIHRRISATVWQSSRASASPGVRCSPSDRATVFSSGDREIGGPNAVSAAAWTNGDHRESTERASRE
jgi:hypothetical protein